MLRPVAVGAAEPLLEEVSARVRIADGRREDLSHRYAWVPFGGHAHKCIGLHFAGIEVKELMHQILLRFSWTVPLGYEPPLGYGTGPNPTDGLPVRLRSLSPR